MGCVESIEAMQAERNICENIITWFCGDDDYSLAQISYFELISQKKKRNEKRDLG